MSAKTTPRRPARTVLRKIAATRVSNTLRSVLTGPQSGTRPAPRPGNSGGTSPAPATPPSCQEAAAPSPSLAHTACYPSSPGSAAGSFACRCRRFDRERELRGQMGRLATCSPRRALGPTLRRVVLLSSGAGQRRPAKGFEQSTRDDGTGIGHYRPSTSYACRQAGNATHDHHRAAAPRAPAAYTAPSRGAPGAGRRRKVAAHRPSGARRSGHVRGPVPS